MIEFWELENRALRITALSVFYTVMLCMEGFSIFILTMILSFVLHKKKKFSSTLRQETGSAPDFMHEIRKLVSQWRFLRFKQFPNLQGHVLCLKSKI